MEETSLIEKWKKTTSWMSSDDIVSVQEVKEDLEKVFNEADKKNTASIPEPCCAWNIKDETEYCDYHYVRSIILGGNK